MPTRKSPRKGSLQFWPRKRARKSLPRVNWDAISNESKAKGLRGFIGYKVCMMTAEVKDKTPNSLTKDKTIIIPVTVLECPVIKIFSVRFYKNGKVAKEVVAENLEKDLKRKVKIPKIPKKIDSIKIEDYDNVKVIAYSVVKKTDLKKTPDLSEIDIVGGDVETKMIWVKDNLNKEISIANIFEKGQLVDVRGLTKGQGFSGPVKRFGIGLKSHKSEKGRRNPGSLGPWHPARVTFRAPQAGQLGMFTRVIYNNLLVDFGKISDDNKNKFKNIKNYGEIKSEFVIIRGSVQGPSKRQLLLTAPLRETKKQLKKSFELVEVR